MNKFYFFPILLIAIYAEAQTGTATGSEYVILNGDTLRFTTNVLPATGLIASPYLVNASVFPRQSTPDYLSTALHKIENTTQGEVSVGSASLFINGQLNLDYDSLIKEFSSSGQAVTQATAGVVNLSGIYLGQSVVTPTSETLASPGLEEFHDADKVGYYRPDYSRWAVAFSDSNNTSLVLYAGSKSFPGNSIGRYAIQTNDNKDFELRADSTGAFLGWANSSSLPLNIEASSVYLNGVLNANPGIIISDGTIGLSNLVLPPGIQAFFNANENSTSGICIANQSIGANASAAIFITVDGNTNSLSTWGNGPIHPGGFAINSLSGGGVWINALDNENGISGPISLGVHSQEILRIDDIYGTVLMGTSAPEEYSILTINSISKGMLPPRMSSVRRRAMVNPPKGLIVFDLDIDMLCYYDGTHWRAFAATVIN